MKIIVQILVLLTLVSCKNQDAKPIAQKATRALGQQLFETCNCVACHQTAQNVVGPSLQSIATIYKQKNGNMVAFLKEEAEPIVAPENYESMKLNLEITKTMTDSELKSLELYILSYSK